MPSVTPSPTTKVLVTGASGFIAVWVVQSLLENGFFVRGTVRSSSQGDYLTNKFGKEKFEYVVVEDVAVEGAFDKAVEGVDAVEHTASKVTFEFSDPDELIKPAVDGTLSILKSILKYGKDVRRVIITSSIASIFRFVNIPPKFTEKDWNEISVKIFEEEGRNAPGVDVYRASKTLAERAAWKFVEDNKAEIKWDLVTLHPPMVYGPIINQVSSLSKLSTTPLQFYKVITGQSPIDNTPRVHNWVDVRDVAEAHVKALVVNEAGGQRFIISEGNFIWQDFLDAIHAPPPDPLFENVPVGEPGAGKGYKHDITLDTTKAREVLGMKFRTVEESGKEIARSLLGLAKQNGW
ncbi:hypothetical protein M422DRAFT_222631 [Sphaerobolus stellatus SS14]|nr:hypothetical protein M422DRAFT_222631 [Sphaerobolus stellatus SS14]